MKRSILKTSVLLILLGLLLSLAVSCASAETRTITYYDYDGNKIEGFDDSYYSYDVDVDEYNLTLPTEAEYLALYPKEEGRVFECWNIQTDNDGLLPLKKIIKIFCIFTLRVG